MRQRKFRAWNKAQRKMIYIGEDQDIALQFGNNGWPKTDNDPQPRWDVYKCTQDWPIPLASDKEGDILMDYTQYKDVKNRDVFEGDILKCETGEDEIIEWKRCSPWCRYRDISLYELWSHQDIEVIGNIYENPQ